MIINHYHIFQRIQSLAGTLADRLLSFTILTNGQMLDDMVGEGKGITVKVCYPDGVQLRGEVYP